ncbi:MAG: 3-phosphoserine/phosphohydroxythreonine transaminase [Polyangiales bacterium]
MTRVINFNPGPAALPLPALEAARDELLDYQGTGMSIMEHSHRGADYEAVHAETKALLTELLGIPDTHQILFIQGGATMQFAMVPMNLLAGKSADYAITGTWAEGAFKEAKLVGQAREAANTKKDGSYTRVPTQAELQLDPDAAYFHYTTNNTIYGTQYHYVPETGNVPLVADMSSDILWKPMDIAKYGLIYAGAQKNIGIAGITLVIIRKDLLERSPKTLPKLLRYTTYAENDSLQNTIPTFPIYMMRNVLRWVKSEGGAAGMEKRNRAKAEMLYRCIDENASFYRGPVEKDSRSTMTPVFRLPTEDLEKKFVSDAKKQGLVGLKGHRSAGGIRASIYNALGPSDVEKLVAFMVEFAKANG